MKNLCIGILFVVVVWIAGCTSSYEQQELETRSITLIVDTQPSGAEIYKQVSGDAWVKCQGSTPVRLDFVLQRFPRRPAGYPWLLSVNGQPVNESDHEDIGGYGFSMSETINASGIYLKHISFRKPGYLPFRPLYPKDGVDSDTLWERADKYSDFTLLLPLRQAPTSRQN